VTLAQSYGIDEAELKAMAAAPPPASSTTSVPDPTRQSAFVPREAFVEFAQTQPLIAAEIADITAEHHELFGKALKGTRQLTEKAIREGRTLREVWEEANGVPARRQEIETQTREAEIQRRVQEEVTKFRTANSIPAPVHEDPLRFNILEHKIEAPDDNSSSAAKRADAVSAAVATFNNLQSQRMGQQ